MLPMLPSVESLDGCLRISAAAPTSSLRTKAALPFLPVPVAERKIGFSMFHFHTSAYAACQL